jgi:hypothetical protein
VKMEKPCVKGPVTYCLDALSARPDARELLQRLGDAISGLRHIEFRGLQEVFARYLLSPVLGGRDVPGLTEYLKDYWFDEKSGDAFFPNFQPIAPIYATGMLKTIELSLQEPNTKPIDSWWLLDYPNVEIINLVSRRQVTLLIATPRPPKSPRLVWGEEAQAWATVRSGIVTAKAKNLPINEAANAMSSVGSADFHIMK